MGLAEGLEDFLTVGWEVMSGRQGRVRQDRVERLARGRRCLSEYKCP